MKPYYEKDGITIFCGDCREILPTFAPGSFDAVVTDPPYGIDGGRGGDRAFGKAKYSSDSWSDTPTYIADVVVPTITDCIELFGRVVVTPGLRCMWSYPQAYGVGCFWLPAAQTHGPWGFNCFTPILFYGRDPRSGIGQWPSGIQVTEASEKNGHPCPKPINAWRWLTEKASMPGETILDPFMGSGTTLVAAKQLGRKAVGIEIEERYCEIAARRLDQKVFQFPKDETPAETPAETQREMFAEVSA